MKIVYIPARFVFELVHVVAGLSSINIKVTIIIFIRSSQSTERVHIIW